MSALKDQVGGGHYKGMAIQPAEFVHANRIPYLEGSVIYYVARWRANDRGVRQLLKTTELWFLPVANPDGYQYTFEHERLWRKNLRDTNGNGSIASGDGIDTNRSGYAEVLDRVRSRMGLAAGA